MVGKGSVNHNSRKFTAENVNGERTHLNIDYCNEPIKKVYHELFDEALKEYNARQTRKDRVIEDYYEKKKLSSDEERKQRLENGILYSSGLIAGEGLVGILLAVFAIIPFGNGTWGEFLSNLLGIRLGNMGGLFFFAILCGTMIGFINKKAKV